LQLPIQTRGGNPKLIASSGKANIKPGQSLTEELRHQARVIPPNGVITTEHISSAFIRRPFAFAMVGCNVLIFDFAAIRRGTMPESPRPL